MNAGNSQKTRRKSLGKWRGFTLIELMITVAVVAILAAIAYPSYLEQIRKSRRADAKAVLLEAAQWMERYYTSNNRYDQDRASTPNLVTSTTSGIQSFPNSGLTASPKEGATKYYNLSLSAVTANTYTLQAAPTGAQSGDGCKTLTLTNTGARGLTDSPTKTVDECWR
ncbi:MAG: type IV pilin protein [Candidatus Competibacter sp.]|nr:type IV pilin protein [Candidatus Competibacter sp.]